MIPLAVVLSSICSIPSPQHHFLNEIVKLFLLLTAEKPSHFSEMIQRHPVYYRLLLSDPVTIGLYAAIIYYGALNHF
jgi:hypothetical protein